MFFGNSPDRGIAEWCMVIADDPRLIANDPRLCDEAAESQAGDNGGKTLGYAVFWCQQRSRA